MSLQADRPRGNSHLYASPALLYTTSALTHPPTLLVPTEDSILCRVKTYHGLELLPAPLTPWCAVLGVTRQLQLDTQY